MSSDASDPLASANGVLDNGPLHHVSPLCDQSGSVNPGISTAVQSPESFDVSSSDSCSACGDPTQQLPASVEPPSSAADNVVLSVTSPPRNSLSSSDAIPSLSDDDMPELETPPSSPVSEDGQLDHIEYALMVADRVVAKDEEEEEYDDSDDLPALLDVDAAPASKETGVTTTAAATTTISAAPTNKNTKNSSADFRQAREASRSSSSVGGSHIRSICPHLMDVSTCPYCARGETAALSSSSSSSSHKKKKKKKKKKTNSPSSSGSGSATGGTGGHRNRNRFQRRKMQRMGREMQRQFRQLRQRQRHMKTNSARQIEKKKKRIAMLKKNKKKRTIVRGITSAPAVETERPVADIVVASAALLVRSGSVSVSASGEEEGRRDDDNDLEAETEAASSSKSLNLHLGQCIICDSPISVPSQKRGRRGRPHNMMIPSSLPPSVAKITCDAKEAAAAARRRKRRKRKRGRNTTTTSCEIHVHFDCWKKYARSRRRKDVFSEGFIECPTSDCPGFVRMMEHQNSRGEFLQHSFPVPSMEEKGYGDGGEEEGEGEEGEEDAWDEEFQLQLEQQQRSKRERKKRQRQRKKMRARQKKMLLMLRRNSRETSDDVVVEDDDEEEEEALLSEAESIGSAISASSADFGDDVVEDTVGAGGEGGVDEKEEEEEEDDDGFGVLEFLSAETEEVLEEAVMMDDDDDDDLPPLATSPPTNANKNGKPALTVSASSKKKSTMRTSSSSPSPKLYSFGSSPSAKLYSFGSPSLPAPRSPVVPAASNRPPPPPSPPRVVAVFPHPANRTVPVPSPAPTRTKPNSVVLENLQGYVTSFNSRARPPQGFLRVHRGRPGPGRGQKLSFQGISVVDFELYDAIVYGDAVLFDAIARKRTGGGDGIRSRLSYAMIRAVNVRLRKPKKRRRSQTQTGGGGGRVVHIVRKGNIVSSPKKKKKKKTPRPAGESSRNVDFSETGMSFLRGIAPSSSSSSSSSVSAMLPKSYSSVVSPASSSSSAVWSVPQRHAQQRIQTQLLPSAPPPHVSVAVGGMGMQDETPLSSMGEPPPFSVDFEKKKKKVLGGVGIDNSDLSGFVRQFAGDSGLVFDRSTEKSFPVSEEAEEEEKEEGGEQKKKSPPMTYLDEIPSEVRAEIQLGLTDTRPGVPMLFHGTCVAYSRFSGLLCVRKFLSSLVGRFFRENSTMAREDCDQCASFFALTGTGLDLGPGSPMLFSLQLVQKETRPAYVVSQIFDLFAEDSGLPDDVDIL